MWSRGEGPKGGAEGWGTRELSSNLSCLLQTLDSQDQEPTTMAWPAYKYEATWEPPLQETSPGNHSLACLNRPFVHTPRVPPTKLHHDAFQPDCLAGRPLDQCRVRPFDPPGFCPEMRKETTAESMAHTQHEGKEGLYHRRPLPYQQAGHTRLARRDESV
jgi:hypothetical protein